MADPRQLEHPAKGWAQPGDVFYCDCCGRRIWLRELHHLIPIAWDGSDSRLETDRQVIWAWLCGDCHGTVHMILDRAKHDGGWPALWITSLELPHWMVETARRGWNGYKKSMFGEPT